MNSFLSSGKGGAWIPEGLTAFCQFVAHWSAAYLVLAVECQPDGEIHILASSSDLSVKQLKFPDCCQQACTNQPIIDLSAVVPRLPSALLIHYPEAERSLFFLPAGEEDKSSGLLILKSGSMGTSEDRSTQGYLGSVLRQMLSDYRSLRERRYFRAKFHDLFDSLPIGILLIEGDGVTGHVNSAAEAILGISAGQSSVADISHALQLLRKRCKNADDLQRLCSPLQQDLQFAIQMDWITEDRVLHVDTHPILGDGRQGRVWILQDVTAERMREKTLQDTAEQDALTGAYNRYFLQQYTRGFEMQQNLSPRPVAVLMIDIDHFKAINDQFGHPCGDAVLRAVADRLRSRLRQREGGTLIRWGGEEFVALVPVEKLEEGQIVGERLLYGIASQPIRVDDSVLPVTISIGATYYQSGERLIEKTIPRADTALYRAKHGGRNRCEWS